MVIIHVVENITSVNFSVFKGKKMLVIKPKSVADFLLLNPAYTVQDGFVINKKHSTTLFRLKFIKDVFNAPIDYDPLEKGYYYYGKNFTLSLD